MSGTVVGEAMRGYYERRAAEYDDWWLGTGRFARRARQGWAAEVERLVGVLAALAPARTLDVACGTGFLTRHLPGDVTGLDQSASMVALASARLKGGSAVQGEAVPAPFADGAFERLHTAHFYGHLLDAERAPFLAEARRLAAELVVVDSARRPETGAEAWQERILDDGTRHAVYKRWFTGAGLAEELGGGTVLLDGEWFVAVATGG